MLLYKPSLRNVEQHTDASFYFQGLERAFCICPVLETCQTSQRNIVCVHAEGRGEEEEINARNSIEDCSCRSYAAFQHSSTDSLSSSRTLTEYQIFAPIKT